METFYKDLIRGEAIEQKILNKIKLKYPNAYKVEGYFKDYDLFVPEISKSIEVKYDKKSKLTGNIVVEVEFNNKPSALSTTKADYWVWWDGYKFTWFNTYNIKKCIKETNQKLHTFIGNGDTKSKKAYLIKKETLYKYSIQ
jgi:hypothetical protein